MSTEEVGKLRFFKTYDCPYHFITCQSRDDLSIFQIHELHMTQKLLCLSLRLKSGWFSWSMFTKNKWK